MEIKSGKSCTHNMAGIQLHLAYMAGQVPERAWPAHKHDFDKVPFQGSQGMHKGPPWCKAPSMHINMTLTKPHAMEVNAARACTGDLYEMQGDLGDMGGQVPERAAAHT